MGKMGKFDMSGLVELQKNLRKMQAPDAFVEACAKELAARLLAMVVARTPVGDYSHEVEVTAKRDSKHHKKGDVYRKRVNTSGKIGGTLRRGWTAQKNGGGPGGMKVYHFGDTYAIEIINPVEYASYVEYGHRQKPGRYVPALGKSLKKGWVKGQFMMTISEKKLRGMAPQILEQKIKRYLEGILK